MTQCLARVPLSASFLAAFLVLPATICPRGLAQDDARPAAPAPTDPNVLMIEPVAREEGDVVQLSPGSRAERFQTASQPPPQTPSIAEFYERLAWHLADVETARAEVLNRLSTAKAGPDRKLLETVLTGLETVRRPNQVRLSLADAIYRALAGSYAIRVSSYNPGINAARVVQAEAAFDATFFTNLTNNKINRPTGTQLAANNSRVFNIQGGVRQLTPTGMLVSTGLGLTRTGTDLAFQTINPAWESTFNVSFTQPLLRGFGLDFNRSQINISKNDRRVSNYQFERQVRDTMRDVEAAYWQLVAARRDVVITSRLIAQIEQLYEYLVRRGEFDAYSVQIALAKSRLETRRADFVRVKNNVQNAEDALLALINDPTLNLGDDIEIIPTEHPVLEPLLVDRLNEVQQALDHRQEIQEARLAVDNARIVVGTAKNQALPRLDITFRYQVDGLGRTADSSFDQVTMNDFHEYFFGLEFELPIGNRSRRAAVREAQLRHGQAIAALKQLLEQVILDVNTSVRELLTSYEQIQPTFAAVEAAEENVKAVIARAERRDFGALETELNADDGLANARRNLLSAVTNYNISIIDLERAKGSLLKYNNVTITSPDE